MKNGLRRAQGPVSDGPAVRQVSMSVNTFKAIKRSGNSHMGDSFYFVANTSKLKLDDYFGDFSGILVIFPIGG